MADWDCRGSYALGTACGRCSKCKKQVEDYYLSKRVRENLSGITALKTEIERLKAERDALAEALQNVMGHFDTPIARRKTGISPEANWLQQARAELDKLEKNDE